MNKDSQLNASCLIAHCGARRARPRLARIESSLRTQQQELLYVDEPEEVSDPWRHQSTLRIMHETRFTHRDSLTARLQQAPTGGLNIAYPDTRSSTFTRRPTARQNVVRKLGGGWNHRIRWQAA